MEVMLMEVWWSGSGFNGSDVMGMEVMLMEVWWSLSGFSGSVMEVV